MKKPHQPSDDTTEVYISHSQKEITNFSDLRPEISQNVVTWGDQNDYPEKIHQAIKSTPLVGPIIGRKAKLLFGGGIGYGVKNKNKKGIKYLEELDLPEVDLFLKESRINHFAIKTLKHHYAYGNVFPELGLSKDRKKIKTCVARDPRLCRWRVDKKGFIKELDFGIGEKTNAKKVLMPYLSESYTEQIQKKAERQFIFPSSYPDDLLTYDTPAWHVLLDSWMPVAQEVPKYKGSLLKNQMTLKYHITIPGEFWALNFPNWDTMTQKKKIAKKEEFKIKLDKFLAGAKNTGKSLIQNSKEQSINEKALGLIQIEPIENPIKSGMHIEDSQEADAHIFKNLEMPQQLFGNSIGKSQSSPGSGSDIRVLYNMFCLTEKPAEQVVLEVLNFIADFNGWQKGLEFFFRRELIARLDSGNETEPQTPQA